MLRGDGYAKQVYQIERQIADQLNRRPARSDAWPTDRLCRRIVEILAGAMREEKEVLLTHVTLHPDDPVVLLMWGCYDDLTPQLFLQRLQSEFQFVIPREQLCQFTPCSPQHIDDKRTVREVVEYCARHVSLQRRCEAASGFGPLPASPATPIRERKSS